MPGNAPSRVVLSSVGTKWNDIVVEQHHFPSSELADVMYKRHAICINIGHSFTWVLLALDPVFVRRVAEGLEFDADRIELTEQRGITDSTLRHIALALRTGIHTGDALDRMYGEGLSTALAVHLLREYGASVLRPKRRYGGLPRAKLMRALEYIQDQLNADLTVSGIAQAVYMTPYYFTRLFKESTGQSPYQYVVEARVRKAKELLTTGKFTISEVAHNVGFADQSHLTRHFKRVFGLPPKRLLSRRRRQIVV